MRFVDKYMIPETVAYLDGIEQKIRDFLINKQVPIAAIDIRRNGHTLSLVLPVKEAKKAKFVVEVDADRSDGGSFWYESCFMINGEKTQAERSGDKFNDALKIILTYYTTTPTTTELKCKLVDQKLDKLLNIISNTRQKINPCTI